MNHLRDIQEWLRDAGLAGLVIPSTDEFISEFPPPANRRLLWATGFRGSTGTAVVMRKRTALFLDGRYLQQAAEDARGESMVLEAVALQSRRAWLKNSLPPQARLGMDLRLHSMLDVAQWRSLAAELGFELQILQDNPIDRLWSDARSPEHRPPIIDYPTRYAGQAYQAKCAGLVEYVKACGLQALLVADPEDVSWLLNVRITDEALKTNVGEWHIVPSCSSRALVHRNGAVTWFVDWDRLTPDIVARAAEVVTVAAPERLAMALRTVAAQGPVAADPRRTPAALAEMIEQTGKLICDDTVARRRWRKHPLEVQSAKRAHIVDAAAVVRFMAWLARTVPERAITEFEAAQVLAAFRAEHPDYKGPSMPLMSASGPSGACPHHVPRREGSRKLNDHPIFWMDSGGQYPGGSTDNTLTLAVGTPQPKHILAHTLVLKGFIALATTRFPVGTYALRLDTIARQALWREGMDFAHSTGHGVGNYLNIHEGPQIGREPGPTSTVPLEPGMIVTNEPGYYAEGDFGLRIESHMVVVESDLPNFLEFETISRLPIDYRLVDFDRLSFTDKQWLVDYHRTVLRDLEPLLEQDSAAWLRGAVQAFTLAAINA